MNPGVKTVVNAAQQRGAISEGVVLGSVGGIGGSGLNVRRESRLVDVGMVPPEPADDFTTPERFIQLADALLEH